MLSQPLFVGASSATVVARREYAGGMSMTSARAHSDSKTNSNSVAQVDGQSPCRILRAWTPT